MIRRHVLAALATGVEAGDDDVARAAVMRGDWVLRGPARRTLERSLLDAALLSGELVTRADPDALRHVQRVAALNLAGHHDVDATDRDEVTAAYRTLTAPRPWRAPVATIGLLILVGLLVALVAYRVARGHHVVHRAAPPVAGAYATGGVPVADPELEKLLTGPFVDLLLATDAERLGTSGTGRAAKLAALREPPAIVARGHGLTTAWRELIEALDRWSDAPSRGPHLTDAELELRRSAHAVSDQLAALGLGYHLESAVMREYKITHAAVFVYRVEEVVFVRAASEPRRVLSLRRLDRVNVEHTLLGMQSEDLGDPVVLLDQIDDFVANHVTPVLAGSPYWLGDASWHDSYSGRNLAYAAGDAVRTELAGKHDIAALVTATVRRHEARHGIDKDRDAPLRRPPQLAVLIGTHGDDTFDFRARAELAAYTSQIANDPTTPQLALWNLASQTFNHDRWGTAEAYAGVVIIEGLARHFGIVSRQPVVQQGQLDRSRLAELALPLAHQSRDALRAAARALWSELYGEPLMPIVE